MKEICAKLATNPVKWPSRREAYHRIRRRRAPLVLVLAPSVRAERGLVEEGSPVLVRFIAKVSSRFGVAVSQKVAAQALPVVGALGGAGVNYVFVEHFQDIARGHFIVRRLERIFGKEVVRREYEHISETIRERSERG
jgi:hypothetical protein